MNTSDAALDELQSLLQRLDGLLAEAVAQAQANFGAPDANPYRGLYVGNEEVARLLVREPGEPVLRPADGEVGLSATAGEDSRLRLVQRSFLLTSFDLDVLLIALAPEFDLRYERLYAYLQDDMTRRRPTVDLALNLLCHRAEEKLRRRAHFAADAPLIQHGLVSLVSDPNPVEPPLLAQCLRPAPQVVRLLLEGPGSVAQVPFCRLIEPAATVDAGRDDVLRTVLPLLQPGSAPPRLHLHGPSVAALRETAEKLAGAAGLRLLVLDVPGAVDARAGLEDLLPAMLHEACLQRAVVCLEGFDTLRGNEHRGLRERLLLRLSPYQGCIVFTGSRRWTPVGGVAVPVIDLAVPLPDFDLRRDSWDRALAAARSEADDTAVTALAGRFRFTCNQIERAVTTAARTAALRNASAPERADLFAAARAESAHDLDGLAVRIEPRYTWTDLVLPADQLAQLREICQHVHWRHLVLGQWGFDRKIALGKGLTVLLSGPSGTGKTMAADVLASELGLDLYKIDLSQVISKYIGETEKRLERIFTEAQESNAILFFDEADAVFGKRSEVKDAHDRYANIETSYLLQRMEAYEGITILATNLRRNMDEAFLRRLSFAVDFPHPSEELRREIWRKVWPAGVPLAPDLDLAFLARQFEFPGGHIRNVALNAAFLAAANGGAVTTGHVLAATRREFQKLGRVCVPDDFGPYRELVAGGG